MKPVPRGERRLVIVAAILIALAIWLAWSALIEISLVSLVLPAALAVAAVGLLLRQPWARWLVLGCVAFTCLAWLWAVGAVVAAGWPYENPFMTVGSLIPGVSLMALWAGICAALWRPKRNGQQT